jgi:hypothetical protein
MKIIKSNKVYTKKRQNIDDKWSPHMIKGKANAYIKAWHVVEQLNKLSKHII